MSQPIVPLGNIPTEVAERMEALGASPGFAPPLYRALASRPGLLTGWAELSLQLRLHAVTSRRVLELVIVRTAILCDSEFERKAHENFAREHGVTQEELDALENWRSSEFFSSAERAALALSDAMHHVDVSDDVVRDLTEHFDAASVVELIVTCGFYAMVPRVNNAMRVN